MIKNIAENNIFFGLLSAVWLYLLGLCLLIGMLLVDIGDNGYSSFVNFLISTGKVVISLIFVGIWLVSWYKALGYIFYYELNVNKSTDPIDTQN